MILVDTSIWVDHIRDGDPNLALLLDEGNVLVHPFVIGELAVANLRDRDVVLRRLQRLVYSAVASDPEVLRFIRRYRLYGRGIGYVDCHLLAGVTLTPGAFIWTRDKRLALVAESLGLAASLSISANGAQA